MDLEGANLDKLRGVFPEIFAEGRLDLTKLLDLLGQYDIKDFEKYKFEWKGKSECLQLAQRRSLGTLLPKPDESVNFADTQNVYIKGDNLEALKLLQSAYYRQVKMIYIKMPTLELVQFYSCHFRLLRGMYFTSRGVQKAA